MPPVNPLVMLLSAAAVPAVLAFAHVRYRRSVARCRRAIVEALSREGYLSIEAMGEVLSTLPAEARADAMRAMVDDGTMRIAARKIGPDDEVRLVYGLSH